jgi:hypothetical protein
VSRQRLRFQPLSVTITLSQSQVEKLLSILDEGERCFLEVRSLLSGNTSTKPAQASTPSKTPSIEYVKWRIKGRGAAGSSDDFAFDFTQDRDGKVSRDKAPIIDSIKKNGPFQVEGYEVNLSKDGKLLQRKRM